MKYQLEITKAARQDLQESYDWYDAKLTGLGEDFIFAVEANRIHTKLNCHPPY